MFTQTKIHKEPKSIHKSPPATHLEHLNRLFADLHPSRLEDLDAAKVLKLK